MLKWTASRFLANIVVYLIIAFCFVPWVIFSYPHTKSEYASLANALLVLLTVFTALILWTYFFAVYTDPGFLESTTELSMTEQELKEVKEQTKLAKDRISKLRRQMNRLKSDAIDEEESIIDDKAKLEFEINKLYSDQLLLKTFCNECQLIRPVRTHHCKTCRRCVLRMDHHCPWTGNCVGVANQKYFVQFLFYASFTLVLFYGSFIGIYFGLLKKNASFSQDVLIKFNFFFSVIIGLSIGYLFVYQLRNCFLNLTTVEDNIKGLALKKPFDKGWNKNLEEVFGKNYKLYHVLFPIKNSNSPSFI